MRHFQERTAPSHAAFHLLVRGLGNGTVSRVLNARPDAAAMTSSLCLAVRAGVVVRLEHLLSIEACLECKDSEDGTALLVACARGRLQAVKSLVQQVARISYGTA